MTHVVEAVFPPAANCDSDRPSSRAPCHSPNGENNGPFSTLLIKSKISRTTGLKPPSLIQAYLAVCVFGEYDAKQDLYAKEFAGAMICVQTNFRCAGGSMR